tara:strand:+ start:384 stop:635 length:252 start_codon:yes stop_codon:yes gene_type:complete
MEKVFLRVLREINKLPSLDRNTFLKLNSFQLEALSKIVFKKKIKSSALLSSQSPLSKAQKYRYLKELVDKGLCKKKHNLFYKF